VVALTNRNAAGEEQKALTAGCDGYIPKPVDTAVLTARMRQMLRRPAPLRALPAPSADNSAPAFTAASMDHFRRGFLHEASEHTRQLLDKIGSGFDSEQAGSMLDSWSQTADAAGYPETCKIARAAADLARMGSFRQADLKDSLNALLGSLSSLLEGLRVPIPHQVANGLRGKAIALIGFPKARAAFLGSTLGEVHARPLLFEISEDPDSVARAECDLTLVHAAPGAAASAWFDAAKLPDSMTLLFAGARADLLTLDPKVLARAAGLLADTWHPEEMLMQLHMALIRRAAPPHTAAAPATAAPTAAAAPSPAASQRINVLVADDDPLILTVVGSTLENYGMKCRQVKNGEEAARVIRETLPQIAVLEVNMPGMDGYEVLSAIRAENLPVMVVLLTARQREADILRGFQLGADDYLVKPFNPLELVARLKRLVRR
jgi:DNA-binding response OmpR family regulator